MLFKVYSCGDYGNVCFPASLMLLCVFIGLIINHIVSKAKYLVLFLVRSIRDSSERPAILTRSDLRYSPLSFYLEQVIVSSSPKMGIFSERI